VSSAKAKYLILRDTPRYTVFGFFERYTIFIGASLRLGNKLEKERERSLWTIKK
jgi:hypothetical protein